MTIEVAVCNALPSHSHEVKESNTPLDLAAASLSLVFITAHLRQSPYSTSSIRACQLPISPLLFSSPASSSTPPSPSQARLHRSPALLNTSFHVTHSPTHHHGQSRRRLRLRPAHGPRQDHHQQSPVRANERPRPQPHRLQLRASVPQHHGQSQGFEVSYRQRREVRRCSAG